MNDKERLENMSPIGFDLNGNVLLKSEDYHWLMEQAELAEQLEEENRQLYKKNFELMKDNRDWYKQADSFQKENQRYKQALEEIDNEAETAIHYGFTSLKDFCYRLRKQIEKAMEGEK